MAIFGFRGDKSRADILEAVYPIGAIYMSVNNTNPSTLLGGTWERIENRFLLAAGSSYSAGSTGGEATHKLTQNEMPSHYHLEFYNLGTNDQTLSASNYPASVYYSQGDENMNYQIQGRNSAPNVGRSSSVGGGAAHNNMPPYLAVYMWERTA